MIVSASRRTDIPAFYAEWFLRRVRAGYCEVPNPLNPRQVARISLLPEDADALVFWTRSPRGMISKLHELDSRDLRYYFQFTLCGYGPPIERHNPSKASAIDSFKGLASRVGPDKVMWRYDPVVFSEPTGAEFHLKNFETIANALTGHTRRCVVSIWDNYRKLANRLDELATQDIHFRHPSPEELDRLIPPLAQICSANGMEIVSCAEEINLIPYGVKKGKCIDDDLIQRLFGIDVCHNKDRTQRPACGCVQSRDIGMYNSCLFGCAYCYATSSFLTAARNYRRHDPDAPALLPR